MFNKYSEYNFDLIPSELGYFAKKNWINNKIKTFSDSNILVFNEKNYFSWVLLDEGEKFWLPYEKLLFFKDKLKIKENNYLIIESNNEIEFYYVVIDGFLFSYSNEYYKSLEVFKEYNISIYATFGVGDVQKDCDYKDEFCVKETSSEYGVNQIQDDLFFLWFEENVKNKRKEIYYIVLNLSLIVLFNFLNIYLFCVNKKLEEILGLLIN